MRGPHSLKSHPYEKKMVTISKPHGPIVRRTFEDVAELWIDEVQDPENNIDPDGDIDWYDMSIGWSLAKGMDEEQAHEFAAYLTGVGRL